MLSNLQGMRLKNKSSTFKVVSLFQKAKMNWKFYISVFSSVSILALAHLFERSRLYNIIPFSLLYFPLVLYLLYRIWSNYLDYRVKEQNSYEKRLKYFIKSNNLFETETQFYETIDSSGRRKKESRKVVVASARFGIWEDKNEIIIRAFKDANKWNQQVAELDNGLSSLMKLEVSRKNDGINFTDYHFDKSPDKRLYLNKIPPQKGTIINVTEKISYDISKVPHGLTIGGTGSGKSFYINSKIIDYARMGAEIYVADPKSADLSLLRFIDGWEKKVASEPNHIARLLREVNEIMENRYKELYNDTSAFGKTFTDFKIPPVVLVFDEFTAFVKSIDKKLHTECMGYLYNIIMKGRASGVFIELILQRPDASVLDGAIRDQLGTRVALGNLSRQGYEMVFGSSETEYRTITEKGGGYIKIDGQHNDPVYFETPFLPKDFNFVKELESICNQDIKN